MHRKILALAAALSVVACRERATLRPPAEMLRDTVPVLVGAGDVADCRNGESSQTAAILDTVRGTIFVAGDVAYPTKKVRDPLHQCYAPNWGRHLARTRPSPGNHEYEFGNADQYFNYFGDLAGPRPGGYYSYELGDWHVVALNTNLASDSASPQGQWLRADLAAHAGHCAVAYMHHPRFSSGPHSERERIAPLWNMLVGYGVSVVIAGHDHIYERFSPLDTAGNPDMERGARQFVAGTGGADNYEIKDILPGSGVQSGTAHGVLKLMLFTDHYRWDFIPVDADGFRDSGSSVCHPLLAAR
ncbi:MAG: metallophosphoesterase [Gemmatimonadaceae bacterium]